MKFDLFSRIPVAANRVLATLVVLTGLGLATPSAFANIPLSWSATDTGVPTTVTGSGTGFLSVGPTTVGNFSVQITANTSDPAGGSGTTPASSSQLSTTTFTISNNSSATDTLDLAVTGTGFSVKTSDNASFSVSGSSSAYNPSVDSTTANSTINGTPIPGGGMIGTPPLNGNTSTYTWSPSSNSGSLLFTNSSTFSIGQALDITLAANDSVTLTINTTVKAVPEPSSMAIAGLGALGMIGYGLRRRKALGA